MKETNLDEYAKEQLNVSAYADDVHVCTTFQCEYCGRAVPFSVLISYSEACDKARPPSDFAGTVYGTCTECGTGKILFSIVTNGRPEVEDEHPVCSCGSDAFILCMCERYEGEYGLAGFFDEGVIVGKCAVCGTNRTFLFTD